MSRLPTLAVATVSALAIYAGCGVENGATTKPTDVVGGASAGTDTWSYTATYTDFGTATVTSSGTSSGTATATATHEKPVGVLSGQVDGQAFVMKDALITYHQSTTTGVLEVYSTLITSYDPSTCAVGVDATQPSFSVSWSAALGPYPNNDAQTWFYFATAGNGILFSDLTFDVSTMSSTEATVGIQVDDTTKGNVLSSVLSVQVCVVN